MISIIFFVASPCSAGSRANTHPPWCKPLESRRERTRLQSLSPRPLQIPRQGFLRKGLLQSLRCRCLSCPPQHTAWLHLWSLCSLDGKPARTAVGSPSALEPALDDLWVLCLWKLNPSRPLWVEVGPALREGLVPDTVWACTPDECPGYIGLAAKVSRCRCRFPRSCCPIPGAV